MIEVRQTADFTNWLDGLRDAAARLRIVARIRRVEIGNSVMSNISMASANFGSTMAQGIGSIL